MANTGEIQASPEFSNGQGMFFNPGLHARIAEAAYYKAEQRGFEPGHDLGDWLEAEQEILVREGIIHCPKSAVQAPRKAA